MSERYMSGFDRSVPTNSGDVGIEQCLYLETGFQFCTIECTVGVFLTFAFNKS
jgi:hypothetical protein